MTEYTDRKNNTYPIIQRVLLRESAKKEREEEILEALYRIFMKKIEYKPMAKGGKSDGDCHLCTEIR